MAFKNLPRHWAAKPAPGAQVNRSLTLSGGLLGFWPLAEGGGPVAADATGNGHAGTLSGTAWAPGGLSFNGTSSYVDLAGAAALGPTGDRSVFVGFRYSAAPASRADLICAPVDQSATDTPSYLLYVSSSGVFGGGIDGSPGYSGYTTIAGALSLGDHVGGITLAGNAVSLCIDGKVGSSVTRSSTSVATGVANVGRYNSAVGQYFTDRIYWVGIWSRALSPTEIQALYADPYALLVPPPARRLFGGFSLAPTSRSQGGVARITASPARTQPGVSRVTATAARTQPGLSRVTAPAARLQAGIARITASAARTQAGTARITAAAARLQAGVARVTATTLRTVAGVAAVAAPGSSARTQGGLARVTAAASRTQGGLARIRATAARTAAGMARIGTVTARNQPGVSRLVGATARTVAGIARLAGAALRSQPGLARLSRTVARTQPGVSSVVLQGPRLSGSITDLTYTGSATVLTQNGTVTDLK